MQIQTYLALEIGLTRRLQKAWQRESRPAYQAIAAAVSDEDWHKATALALTLDMTHVGEENKSWIKHYLLGCAVFGAKMANKKGPQFVGVGNHDARISHVADLMCAYFEHRGTALVQTRALQSIAEAERQAKARDLKMVTKDDRKPLYVSRLVLNTDALIAWAKLAGLKTTCLPEDMHITIVYSKAPMDWASPPPNEDPLEVPAQGRSLKMFGDACVLAVTSTELTARWQQFKDAGASWDYPEYQPHVTLTYQVPPGWDIAKAKPFMGTLVLGPEVYEAINSDKELVEKDDMTNADLSIAGKLNPLQSIANPKPRRKRRKVVKADANGRYATPFVSFNDDGNDLAQLVSSLNSSRMASWGFMAECEQTGQTQYQISAVMDARCCPFCAQMDGRVFTVSAGNDLINDALSVQDPADLAQVQPWPDSSKAAAEGYADMSDQEIQDAGFSLGPYHPSCRCMAVTVEDDNGDNQGEEVSGAGGGDNTGSLLDQEATADDFDALGIDISDEELDHWNQYVGLNPVEALSAMFGGDADVEAGDLAGKTIKVQSDGSVQFKDEGDLNDEGDPINPDESDASGSLGEGDSTYSMQSIFDPFSGNLYMTEADFQDADPSVVADFLAKVYSGMIDTGKSAGATALTLDVADSAYQYAQMGFLPQADDWQTIRMDAIDSLQGGELSDVFASLDADQKDILLNLLSNPDEQALQTLVDLPWDIDGQTIGQILLDGVSGDFSLDLTDDEQVARAMEYFA